MRKYRCTICGEIFESELPPASCPICGVGAELIEDVTDDAGANPPKNVGGEKKRQWRCNVCGQIFEGDEPPVPCPICGAGRDAFEEIVDTGEEEAFRSDTDERFFLIGGGVAALETARAIRKHNRTARITLISRESYLPYSRPALSDLLGGMETVESISVVKPSELSEKCFTVMLETEVTEILPREHALTISTGDKLVYDKLCLCTGAEPFNPYKSMRSPIPVCTLRTYDDAQELNKLCAGRRVLIVGGGILGLEAAVALRQNGSAVTIVEKADRLLPIQADEHASMLLKQGVEQSGIPIHVGASIVSFDEAGAQLESGEHIGADVVLVSIGVRSNLALATAAGLATERGVLVDERMQTSIPGVYACGDCAQVGGRVYGLWSASAEQGAVAGAAMAGDPNARYLGTEAPLLFEGLSLSFLSVGKLSGEGVKLVCARDDKAGRYRLLALRDGGLCGVLLFGESKLTGNALALLARHASLSECLPLLSI